MFWDIFIVLGGTGRRYKPGGTWPRSIGTHVYVPGTVAMATATLVGFNTVSHHDGRGIKQGS